VDFNFSAPHAGSISIAGDFSDWNPGSHPMKKDKKGVWKISLNLAPQSGSIHFGGPSIFLKEETNGDKSL
jgi:1,4-alpha-glucan branching enzyme